MGNYILTLDLGTTNIKIGLYSLELEEIIIISLKVRYLTSKKYIEFNPEDYWKLCKKGIKKIIDTSKINPRNIYTFSITSQAETLILLDSENNVLRNAISWMDSRSKSECEFLEKYFNNKESYKITGLPKLMTTWPITKILWIKNNEKQIFNRVCKYLLLKDYIIFKLTGKFVCDYSIASFTYYFDINKKEYWKEILNHVGVDTQQLPELVEPCSVVGITKNEIIKEFNLSDDVLVNVGILDHFAGMIGVGITQNGILSETTGTVLALATLIDKAKSKFFPIPCHCGPFNSYVLLPVCESGGICLEWFKNNFYSNCSFEKIDSEVEKNISHVIDKQLIFLPYIMGTNSPEFNQSIKGGFYGLDIRHKKVDLAISIFEGLAFILRKNMEYLKEKGIKINKIISIGGGSRSSIWNQIKANVIQEDIHLPKYKETTSFGAAIIGAATSKKIDDFRMSLDNHIDFSVVSPNIEHKEYYNIGYYKFIEIYNKLESLFSMNFNKGIKW